MKEAQVFERDGIVIILSGPVAHVLVLGKACITLYVFPMLLTNEDPSRCEHLEKMAIAYTAEMGHAGEEFQGGQDVKYQARHCHGNCGSVRRHKLSQCGEDLETAL
jgi:hypothetical protein